MTLGTALRVQQLADIVQQGTKAAEAATIAGEAATMRKHLNAVKAAVLEANRKGIKRELAQVLLGRGYGVQKP